MLDIMETFKGALVLIGLLFVAVNAKKNPKITPFIVNGNETTRKQFPYMAALNDDRGFLCGASIISNQWLLTAAHCVEPLNSSLVVQMGAWNRTDLTEKGQVRMTVPKSNMIWHKDWSIQHLQNDIAVIRLPQPVEFSEFIQPVKLPKIERPYSTYAGEYAIISGWGTVDDDNQSTQPDILQWARTPVMNITHCAEISSGWVKPKTNICGEIVDETAACFGDSGSPFVLVGDDPVQIGLYSFGTGGRCALGDSNVYARITYYLHWIQKNTGIAYR